MTRLTELFFLPPVGVARLGPGETPLESYEWVTDVHAHGGNMTALRATTTLCETEHGGVTAYRPDPDRIRLRDEETGALRPVAPFFELWARMFDETTGEDFETPVTLSLLDALGASLKHVAYRAAFGNRKAVRRTGDAACGFVAEAAFAGDDFEAKPLRGVSPRTSGQQPLVREDHAIPLGTIRAVRPIAQVMGPENGLDEEVDLSVLRLRFTPPKGEVYGPPDATVAPATLAVPGYDNDPPKSEYGRMHEIVPERNRVLNPDTPWSRWRMMTGLYDDPEPHDSYDGARVGDDTSWGVVDDTSDGLIEACLTVGGERFRAIARVLVGPPDYAPDRRPFYSLADELDDRDLPPPEITPETFEAAKAEVLDIFRRAFETNSLVNLDGTRAQGLKDNAGLQAKTNMPVTEGLPSTDGRSMTAEDAWKPSKIDQLIDPQPASIFANGVPKDPLPYTTAAPFVHDQLIDEAMLMDFLRRRTDFVRRLMRPPFGVLSQFAPTVDPNQAPDPAYRDPRLYRDLMHDARMPPYMRDSNYFPLSLSRRQHALMMRFLDHLDATPPEPAAPPEGDKAHG